MQQYTNTYKYTINRLQRLGLNRQHEYSEYFNHKNSTIRELINYEQLQIENRNKIINNA